MIQYNCYITLYHIISHYSYNMSKRNTIMLNSSYKTKCPPIPKYVIHITFDYYFNVSVDNLPKSTKTIKFNTLFNQPVDNLPESVEYISFGHMFNKSVDNLPESVEYISFGHMFNKSVDNLPKLLKTIIFSTEFCRPVDNLPKYVENITFKYLFDQRLDKLPKSVKLKLFDVVKEEDKILWLPSCYSVTYLDRFIQKNSLSIYVKHIEYTVMKNVFEKTNISFNIQYITILQKILSKTKFNKLPYGACYLKN